MARSRRLTVLQMLPSLRGGGVEQGTLEVAGALARAGHRALVMSAGGPMVERIEAAGAEHLRWEIGEKSPATLRFVPRLRRLLEAESVDVVHPRSRVPAWVAWLAWRGLPADARPRLVTTVHGFYSVGRYSAIMTRGERVICVSRSIRDYVLASYPRVDRSRLVLIPRGIDHARFPHGFRPDSAWLARWNAGHPRLRGRRTLLLPGRLTRLKGHEEFVRLIGALRARGVEVHGLIAGGEDPRRRAYAAAVRASIHDAGLDDRITLLGHRDDLREVMAISDLVLSLSTKPESFGRTVLEALSLGRPAAGYAHGGVGEILEALYPPGAIAPAEPQALVETVERLLRDAPAVAASGAFSLDEMLTRTLAVYRDVVASGGG